MGRFQADLAPPSLVASGVGGTYEELHPRAGTSGIRHHHPVIIGAEFCDDLGTAVVPKVTLIGS